MKILQINASARREGANSTKVANSVVERLKAVNPAATFTLRDLAVTPHPVLDEAALGALFTPADQPRDAFSCDQRHDLGCRAAPARLVAADGNGGLRLRRPRRLARRPTSPWERRCTLCVCRAPTSTLTTRRSAS